MSLDDNPRRGVVESTPEPNGEAALLIAESLMHVLIERSVLSVEDVVSALQTAVEVRVEDVSEEGKPAANASLDLIFRILDSLVVDLPGEPSGPLKFEA